MIITLMFLRAGKATGVSKVRLEDLGEVRALAHAAAKLEVDAERPSFTTEELFGPATEIDIAHQGLTYRLKITRQGKLVLNK